MPQARKSKAHDRSLPLLSLCGVTLATLAVAAALSVMPPISRAVAHPVFATQTGMSCTGCHTSPVSTGALSTNGLKFKAQGYSFGAPAAPLPPVEATPPPPPPVVTSPPVQRLPPVAVRPPRAAPPDAGIAEVIILKGATICRSFDAAKRMQWADEFGTSRLIRSGQCYVARGNAPTISAERGPDIVEFRTADNPGVRKFTLVEYVTGLPDAD